MTPQTVWAPPDLGDSIRRRLALLDRANNDPEFRAIALAHCAKNPVDWINDWCWTQDPRRVPAMLPFDMFPRQAEFINWLQLRLDGKTDGLAEKSRDVGFTWLCVAFGLHQWMFRPGFKGTFGSRKKNLVDQLGNPDSIFEKGRILLRSLPWWMLPRYADNELKLLNLSNGSSLVGEGGDNMGRGGRSTLYIIDEAAFIERPTLVDAAISNNSDVKVYVSTPNGPGNPFAQKRFSNKYDVFSFSWRDDPRKDDAWYQKQKDILDPVILAQEVDCDYNASIEGTCIPGAWVQSAVNLFERLGVAAPGGDRHAGLDVADGGKNENVLTIRQGPKVVGIESWRVGSVTQSAYKARDFGREYEISKLNYDCVGSGSDIGGTLEVCDDVPFEIFGVNGGAACSDTYWVRFGGKTSDEIFYNLRAELWWLVRSRFEKTYEHTNGIKEHPLDELIDIPNHGTLIAQLSQPLCKYTDSGKTLLESKQEMSKRGISSPDYADSLIYAFAPVHQSIWAVGQASYGY